MLRKDKKAKIASSQQHGDVPCSYRYDLSLNVNQLTAIVKEEIEKLKTGEEAGKGSLLACAGD